MKELAIRQEHARSAITDFVNQEHQLSLKRDVATVDGKRIVKLPIQF